MHHIAVSILSADRRRLPDEVQRVVAAGADAIHLNVVDAEDRPNLNLGHLACAELRAACPVPMHVHLRVAASQALVAQFAEAGADMLILQPTPGQDMADLLRRVRQAGCQAGLAYGPTGPIGPTGPTGPLAPLSTLIGLLDLVHVACAWPQAPQRQFVPDSLDQIARVRSLVEQARGAGQAIRLQADGDIGPANIAQVAAAGAEDIVIGRALFGASDWAATIAGLRSALASAETHRVPA